MSKLAYGKREPVDWPMFANNLEARRNEYAARLEVRIEDLAFARDTLAKAQRAVESNPRHGARIHVPQLAESVREIAIEVEVLREAIRLMPEVIATIREHGSYMQRTARHASRKRQEESDASD